MIEMTQDEVDAAIRVAEKVHAQAPNANPQAAFLARAVLHLAARQMPALRWDGTWCILGNNPAGVVGQVMPVGPMFRGLVYGCSLGMFATEPEARTAVEVAVRKELGVGQ